MGRVLFGGWSHSQNSMRLGCVFSEEAAELDQEDPGSGEVVQPDAFQLHEFDDDRLLMQPAFPDQLWIAGYDGQISDLNQTADIDAFASFALAAPRRLPARHVRDCRDRLPLNKRSDRHACTKAYHTMGQWDDQARTFKETPLHTDALSVWRKPHS
jgi:hypothetical protein